MNAPDLSHLHALELGLSHERERLRNAKTDRERQLRAVWVKQREKEIEGERKFLGIGEDAQLDLSDDELLAALKE